MGTCEVVFVRIKQAGSSYTGRITFGVTLVIRTLQRFPPATSHVVVMARQLTPCFAYSPGTSNDDANEPPIAKRTATVPRITFLDFMIEFVKNICICFLYRRMLWLNHKIKIPIFLGIFIKIITQIVLVLEWPKLLSCGSDTRRHQMQGSLHLKCELYKD